MKQGETRSSIIPDCVIVITELSNKTTEPLPQIYIYKPEGRDIVYPTQAAALYRLLKEFYEAS